jgi:hypothetical protein
VLVCLLRDFGLQWWHAVIPTADLLRARVSDKRNEPFANAFRLSFSKVLSPEF